MDAGLSYVSMFGQRASSNSDCNTDAEHTNIKSAFRLFVPSLQLAWAAEYEKLKNNPDNSNLVKCHYALYETWCRRYNFIPSPENQISEKAMNGEDVSKIIPFDLLEKLIEKYTKDAFFVMEKSRHLRIFMGVPEDERGTALHNLAPEKQKMVKEKLLNSVPHPGTLPLEFWNRFPGTIEKKNAPEIDTSGIDTFLRIARALVAMGMPTYLRADEEASFRAFSLAIQDVIWTDIGREALDDWQTKAGILRHPHDSLEAYLRQPHDAMLYLRLVFNAYLWSSVEARLTTRHVKPSNKKDAASMPYLSSNPERKSSTKVDIIKHHDFADRFRLDLWTNPELRHRDTSLQTVLNESFKVKEDGTQMLCDFPEFIMISWGGGLGMSQQRFGRSVHLNAMSYDMACGFSHRSCLYELKIAWRLSSKTPGNELQEQARADDCHIYDSDRYKTQLRHSQAPEESAPRVDNLSWTLETTPVDHVVIVFYRRVSSELNEAGFLMDWKSDPEYKKMYPDLNTASQIESTGDDEVLPDAGEGGEVDLALRLKACEAQPDAGGGEVDMALRLKA